MSARARGDQFVYAAGQSQDAKAGNEDTQTLLQQQHMRLSVERHAAVQVGSACLANVACLSCSTHADKNPVLSSILLFALLE